MLETNNLKLKKIELTDSPPDITVINPNWDVIDEEIYNKTGRNFIPLSLISSNADTCMYSFPIEVSSGYVYEVRLGNSPSGTVKTIIIQTPNYGDCVLKIADTNILDNMSNAQWHDINAGTHQFIRFMKSAGGVPYAVISSPTFGSLKFKMFSSLNQLNGNITEASSLKDIIMAMPDNSELKVRYSSANTSFFPNVRGVLEVFKGTNDRNRATWTNSDGSVRVSSYHATSNPNCTWKDVVTSDHLNYFRFFTELTQLNQTIGSETISGILRNMPNFSMGIFTINSSCNQSQYPSSYGILTIQKHQTSRVIVKFTTNDGEYEFLARLNINEFLGWTKLVTTESAQVSLSNGWQIYVGTNTVVKTADVVHISPIRLNNGTTTQNTVIMTLPAGFRPKTTKHAVAYWNLTKPTLLTIQASGNVSIMYGDAPSSSSSLEFSTSFYID